MVAKRGHKRRPATTEENRENQLVSLAIDLAEKQLAEGTASAQVITHYLKLGSTRERLEQDRLMRENELLGARVDNLASAKKVEELYSAALNAMRSYAGRESAQYTDDYEEYEDYEE
ncbi:MAG: hypothetical protein ABWY25_07340 [Paenisporosarcina sp.]